MGNGLGKANVSTKLNLLAVALINMAAIGALSSCRKPASLSEQINCKQQLRSLWSAIALYRHDHSNQWPSNLEVLTKDMVGRLLTCPGVKTNSGAVSRSDYFYVDWSKLPHGADATPYKYPLMYDRDTSNHDGRGINVLMVDGSVEWDSGASWLKKFAADHPNTKLPMPE